MDFKVYLPDALGERVKAEPDLNLSRTLRDAIEAELRERDAMTSTLKDAQTHEIDLLDREDAPYVGRITGTMIASDGDFDVFLTDDERVILYYGRRQTYEVIEDPQEDLRGMDAASYTEAMHALGLPAVIDL